MKHKFKCTDCLNYHFYVEFDPQWENNAAYCPCCGSDKYTKLVEGTVSSMDKVKISKEQEEAIKTMLAAKGMTLREIVAGRVLQNLTVVNGWEHVSVMNLDHLIRALYIGYEVEETPEDLVKKYFDEQLRFVREREDNEDVCTYAIQKVLNKLGIKIKGVNTNEG